MTRVRSSGEERQSAEEQPIGPRQTVTVARD